MDRIAEKPCLDLVRDSADVALCASRRCSRRQKIINDFKSLYVFKKCNSRFAGEHRTAFAHDLDYPLSSISKDMRARPDVVRSGVSPAPHTARKFFGDARFEVDDGEARRTGPAAIAATMCVVLRMDRDDRAASTRAATLTGIARRRTVMRSHVAQDHHPHRHRERATRRAIDHFRLDRTASATSIAVR